MIDTTLPLLDLHRHLDGNIRPATIWQLATQNDIVLPATQFDDFISHVQIQGSESDLLAFLKKLDWGVAVLKTLDDVKRIAFENVEDAHNAGLNYAELRFSPYYMSMNHNLPISDVVAAVIDGVKTGMQTFNIQIKLIGILSRTFGVEQCQLELGALLAHKNELVAVDLAGDEFNFPGELFVDHFKQVRDAGLQVTVHAGKSGGAKSVWQAINDLGATRIGHGVATIEDEKLMTYMVNNNIAIESCLTSNYQTGTVTDLSQHPLKTFLSVGIKACLNTDDPAVQGIEIKNEYIVAQEVLKLSEDNIRQLQQNALDVCFLSDSEKKALLSSHN
ncbi:adenosine deaminase [Colwellia sp. MSW7]|uniref:Adenosine deaminase n=1 Tax=Colwellia maritima TaxID=2912588 RepID=A0ABS9X1P4_9GAMM|nr:adenosine deaminase [Colwellia maritima]MCI2284174.1 adenosine deaminase [Colwellia maritima]